MNANRMPVYCISAQKMASSRLSPKPLSRLILITLSVVSVAWSLLRVVDLSRRPAIQQPGSAIQTLEYNTFKAERARDTEESELSKRDIRASTKYPPVRQDSLVALCVIQKDSEYYIDEWVQYQLALGVSDIFLYDNSDNFDIKGWAQRMKHGYPQIHVKHYPGKGLHHSAIRDCVKSLRESEKKFKWVGLIDTDEFLVLKKHNTISELLEQHCPEDCGALIVNWILFGHNSETAYAPLPLTKRFTFRQEAPSKRRPFVKSFVRLATFVDIGDTHWFHTTGLRYDTNGPTNAKTLNPAGPLDVAVLHHMRVKSCKELKAKCVRGPGFAVIEVEGNPFCSLPCAIENDLDSSVFDDSAWRFLKERVPAFEAYDTIGILYGYDSYHEKQRMSMSDEIKRISPDKEQLSTLDSHGNLTAHSFNKQLTSEDLDKYWMDIVRSRESQTEVP